MRSEKYVYIVTKQSGEFVASFGDGFTAKKYVSDHKTRNLKITTIAPDKFAEVYLNTCNGNTGTFVNFSNHPSDKWGTEQKEAAEEYGKIIDIQFPNVPPDATCNEVAFLAEEYVDIICDKSPTVVLCQGEFTLSYAVIRRLNRRGIKVVAACSDRVVEETIDENGNTNKNVVFKFVQFREY